VIDRTRYLKIHDEAYKRLRQNKQSSWSKVEDVAERVSFYQSALEKFAAKSILILGCGDGETSLALAQAHFEVTGLDISPTAIQWAKEKSAQLDVKLQFIEGNVVTLSLQRSFDAIIDDHCLHCIIGADRALTLGAVFSNLLPGGIFISRTQCGDPPATAPAEFFKTWDPETRCQIYGGIAGRYFGKPESILEEVTRSGLRVVQQRTFLYPEGWEMLEITGLK